MRHRSLLAVVGLCGLVSSAAAATVTVTPLVMAGDGYLGGTISPGFASVSGFAVNNSGTWLIESVVTLGIGDVLIKGTGTTLPGTIIAQDNDPVPAGAGFSSFGRMSMNNAGVPGFNAFYVNAGSADSGVHYNVSLQVVVEEGVSTAPQYPTGAIFTGFFGGLVNDLDQMLLMASLNDPALTGTANRALIRIDDAPGAATQTVLFKAGDEVVPGRLLTDFQTNPHTYHLASNGRVLASVDMDGDTTNDTGIFSYNGTAWTLVAREGDPCPAVPDRNWANFGSTNATHVNASGNWVARATLNAPTTDDSIIVRNGTDLIAREGSPVPALPAFNFTTFGTGAVAIDSSGNVFYFAQFTNPDTTQNTALFRNNEILVRKGITTVSTGERVTDIAPVQDNFTISDNGRYLLFEGDLTDAFDFVRRGTILVVIDDCRADFNGSGTVTVQDIFDFLSAYFANSPSADFNNSGSVTVQDIFDFLAAYFVGCP